VTHVLNPYCVRGAAPGEATAAAAALRNTRVNMKVLGAASFYYITCKCRFRVQGLCLQIQPCCCQAASLSDIPCGAWFLHPLDTFLAGAQYGFSPPEFLACVIGTLATQGSNTES
jgi:hypothetical protein